MESVGFKEWAVVCEALGYGRQSILLRKGGIAEERDGFSFKHSEFFLFPTWFHEQPQKVREWHGLPSPWAQPGSAFMGKMPIPRNDGAIEIRYAARVESTHTITAWQVADALMPFHILQPEVVRERFHYDDAPGLQVAFVRVYRVLPVWTFPNEKRYGGCRSWVKLPHVPRQLQLQPVLSDMEHEERSHQFVSKLWQ